MKLYSWNVNGIRAVLKKGALQDFIATHDPDILCLQETKASRDQVELDLPQYHEHFFSAVKKGYSGTAIFSKEPALQYIDGFPEDIIKEYGVTGDTYGDPNAEGRVIAAEFEEFWVATVYTPNSKGDLSRLSLRYDQWDKAFLAYMQGLENGAYSTRAAEKHGSDGVQGVGEQQTEASGSDGEGAAQPATPQSAKPVLFCGDLNVAHQEIDLARPTQNVGKHGFTNEERERFDDFLAAGYVDTFRAVYPDMKDVYSWWTAWGGARANNVGWRIDYWLASSGIIDRVQDAAVHADVMGSDHCPVSIELA
ncbi:MAG TPA: exodeoxyribonuclease III [Candidatus Saccharimonadales bacterium]|jgi:exodeoxyribonuclease-3